MPGISTPVAQPQTCVSDSNRVGSGEDVLGSTTGGGRLVAIVRNQDMVLDVGWKGGDTFDIEEKVDRAENVRGIRTTARPAWVNVAGGTVAWESIGDPGANLHLLVKYPVTHFC